MTEETNPDWLKLQRQYWDTYLKMTQQATQDTAKVAEDYKTDSSFWTNALDVYWKSLSPLAQQADTKAVMEKFVTQGQQFFNFATTFLKVFHQAPSDADPELWQQYFDDLKQILADFTNEQRKDLSFWELPLDNWQHVMGSLSPLPDDFFQNLKPNKFTQDIQKNIQHWITSPTTGHAREWQTQLKESTRLWMTYQKSHQEYHNILNKIGMRTVDLMQKKAVELQENNKKIENLRQLYNLWVDCGEMAYSEIVNTDEYAEINARLLNSLMAWKKQESHMIDEMLGSMNMPTRKELDSLHLRLQQLRRETRILKAKQYEERIDKLQGEMRELRIEMEVLKKQVNTPKQVSAPKKKASPRRSTSPKTSDTQSKASDTQSKTSDAPQSKTGE